MRTVLAALVLFGVGCSPRVPEMGILCGTDNSCPPLFSCWSDRVCHRGIERPDAGSADAPALADTPLAPPDAPGPMRNVGNPCTSDAMCMGGDRCGGGVCFATCTPTMPPTGAGCASGEDCIPTPPVAMPFSGVCARTCSGGAVCPMNFECNTAMPVPHCFPAGWF